MLPLGDRTPAGYQVPQPSSVEVFIKRPARRFLYPLYNAMVDRWLKRRYGRNCSFSVDRWLHGQRGNDYEGHRRRINRLLPLRGKAVMIAGCGTGRDIESWLAYAPRAVVGVDHFQYDMAWAMLREYMARQYPGTRLDFRQGDLTNLAEIGSESLDVVGSDAVLEHVRDLAGVLGELWRVLCPGGLIYATFGPLWCCWGGDHVSGYDGIASGYNHLLMPPEEYEAYLDDMGPYIHSEHDGRTWIANGLFSYLRPSEYVASLTAAGFLRRYVAMIIEPRAVRCLNENIDVRRQLSEEYNKLDLIVTGMTIIYEKPCRAS